MTTVHDRTAATTRPARWPLVAVLAVALVLRVLEARGVKLWFDEIYIVLVARRSIPEILHTAALDIHPPLHFLVRHWWQMLGGESERWLRLLSILFGLTGIAFTESLGRRAVSPRAGWIAALFAALCPAHVYLSQMVDVYPMLGALVVVMAWAAWRAVVERDGRHLITLGLVSIAALYTHYLVLAAAFAIALWGAIELRRDRVWLLRWLAVWLVVALAFAPQFRIMIHQFVTEGEARYLTFPSPRACFDLLRAIGFGSFAMPALFVAGMLLALFDRRRRAATWLCLLLLACVVPSTRWWAFVVTRDMMLLAPFVYLLVAIGIGRLPGRVLPLAAVLVVLVFAAREWRHHTRFPEPVQLARAETLISQTARPGELILHAEPHSLFFFRYYEPERRHMLLADPGYHVPYFEGGLVVPDSWMITPAEWAAARQRGEPWWGVRVDRALAARGHTVRAGARDAAEFDSLAHDKTWSFPPARVWHAVGTMH